MLVEDARAVPGSASSELTVFTDWVVFINGSAVALKAYTAYGVRFRPARIEGDPGR